MTDDEMLNGFYGLQIAPYYNNWTHSWYAVENDVKGTA